jgi:hypothetical protein
MTVIEIPAELEEEIEVAARRRGLSREEFARVVLEEKINESKTASADEPVKPRILARNLPVKDLSREHEWIRQHRDEYANQWVALDGDRLVASGEDLKKVAETARTLGAPHALMIRVEPRDALPYVGDLF